jgi:hypothetical protein
MFYVLNNHHRPIRLSDMGIEIQPNKAMDLDTFPGVKGNPRSSKDLNLAIGKGWINIVHKDDGVANTTSEEKKEPEVSKDDLKEIMAEVLKEALGSKSEEPSSNQDEINKALLGAIQGLSSKIDQISSGQPIIKETHIEEDNQISPEDMARINAKAVNRIMGDSQSSINYEEKTVEKPIKLDDLDDLGIG